MMEIGALPKNGFSIVSTFSGCGGSCLGFEMDGYSVRWASEFIPAAQETYRANHPGVILDTKDIRKVTAEEILRATGKSQGEVDVLEGARIRDVVPEEPEPLCERPKHVVAEELHGHCLERASTRARIAVLFARRNRASRNPGFHPSPPRSSETTIRLAAR